MSENPYDSIRNQYAQGAIRAVTIFNGAAVVALLSQLTALEALGIGTAVAKALAWHLLGISVGIAIWIFGFRSAVLGGQGFFLDTKLPTVESRSDWQVLYESRFQKNRSANRWAGAGFILFVISFGCFNAGSFVVLSAYWESAQEKEVP